MATKKTTSGTSEKVVTGKRRKGSAIKQFNKHNSNRKTYRGQGKC